MARNQSKGSTKLRSELGGSQDPTQMKLMDFYKWRREQDATASAKWPNGGPEWDKHTKKMFEIEDARNKYWKEKNKAEKEEKKKEKTAAKESKNAEKNRVEGLAKGLVSEMKPYEMALSKRIYDDEKSEQSDYESRVDRTKGALFLDKPNDIYTFKGLPANFEQTSKNIELKKDDGTVEKARVLELSEGYERDGRKWLTVDEDASRQLVNELKSKGEMVVNGPYHSTGNDYLIKTIQRLNYTTDEKGRREEVWKPEKVALPIEVYKKDPRKDDKTIASEADSRAKDIINSYAEKLIDKTEGIAGKGTSLVGKPKVTLSGSDPWRDSTVEIGMGDKKVTWKTKMIWNRSVNNNSFNQWPTRLKGTEPIE